MKRAHPLLALAIYIFLSLGALLTVCFLFRQLGHFLRPPLADSNVNQSTEQAELPTGEIVSNDSYFSPPGILSGNWGWCHNQLYFQKNSSAPRETMGGDIAYTARMQSSGEYPPPVSLKSARIVYEDGDHLMLVVNNSIYDRYSQSHWSEPLRTGDQLANAFLRTFRKDGESGAGDTLTDENSRPRYGFDHVDTNPLKIVIKRISDGNNYPKFLAYFPAGWGAWFFDLERTRLINGLSPPKDPELTLEISAVTYRGDETVSKNRKEALASPGAREIFHQSVPLSSTEWSNFVYSHTVPDHKAPEKSRERREEIDFLFGFWDATPGCCYLCCRGTVVWGPLFRFIQSVSTGWQQLDHPGFDEGLIEPVYFRIQAMKYPSELSADPAVSIESAIAFLQANPPLSTEITYLRGDDLKLYEQQLAAIAVIASNKDIDCTDVLLPYLNYPKNFGALLSGPMDHYLENAEQMWPAFGAILQRKNAGEKVQKYCLNRTNPLNFRLAALQVLADVDKRRFQNTADKLNAELTNSSPAIRDGLNGIESGRFQFWGVPDIK
jgi:hypothetical protein